MVLVLLYVGVGWLLARGRPPWGDEHHFADTIRLFAGTPWTAVVGDYPQVTPPLFYMLYAAWGRVFGLELDVLRACSAVVGVVTLWMLRRFVARYVSGGLLVFGLCALFLVNPYFPGLSVLVFTDMSALLCVLLAYFWFGHGRFAAAAAALAASLLLRQYAVVFWLALAGAATWGSLFSERRREWVRGLCLLALAPLPLVALVLWWGGLTPPSGREIWIVGDAAMAWNPHALTTYLAFLALYLVPFAAVLANRLRGHGKWWFIALPLGIALQALAPVRATRTAVEQAGIETVGLLHRVLRHIVGSGWGEHVTLSIACSAGVWLLLVFLRDDLRRWRRGAPSMAATLSLTLYLYLAVMPLSYQIWEKYLLLVLPLAVVRLALLPVPGVPGHPSTSVAVDARARAMPVS